MKQRYLSLTKTNKYVNFYVIKYFQKVKWKFINIYSLKVSVYIYEEIDLKLMKSSDNKIKIYAFYLIRPHKIEDDYSSGIAVSQKYLRHGNVNINNGLHSIWLFLIFQVFEDRRG